MDKKQSLSLIHFLPVQTLAGELLSNMLYLIAFQHNATLEVFANSKTRGMYRGLFCNYDDKTSQHQQERSKHKGEMRKTYGM